MDFNKAAEEDLLRDRDLFRQMGQIMTALNTKSHQNISMIPQNLFRILMQDTLLANR